MNKTIQIASETKNQLINLDNVAVIEKHPEIQRLVFITTGGYRHSVDFSCAYNFNHAYEIASELLGIEYAFRTNIDKTTTPES